LELVAKLNLVEKIGFEYGPFYIGFINLSITVNSMASVLPAIIGILICVIMWTNAEKRFYSTNQQGNAYEVSRFELDKSLESINTAIVKNRSNIRKL
jgi:hypothetical protein